MRRLTFPTSRVPQAGRAGWVREAALTRIWSASLTHANGCQSAFHAAVYRPIAATISGTLAKLPQRT